MLGYHSNSVSEALLDLFPDIGLDASKIPDKTQGKKAILLTINNFLLVVTP